MRIYQFASISGLSKDDLVSVVTNGITTVDKSNALSTIAVSATGSKFTTGTLIAQDSNPIEEFTPRFVATPIKGCKAATVGLATDYQALVAEFEDYTVVYVDTHVCIYGNLNFTQLDNGYVPVITSAKSIVYALWQ
jgi:hypothetical protein